MRMRGDGWSLHRRGLLLVGLLNTQEDLAMQVPVTRRSALQSLAGLAGGAMLGGSLPRAARAEKLDPKVEKAVERGLKWLAENQSKLGHWSGGSF